MDVVNFESSLNEFSILLCKRNTGLLEESPIVQYWQFTVIVFNFTRFFFKFHSIYSVYWGLLFSINFLAKSLNFSWRISLIFFSKFSLVSSSLAFNPTISCFKSSVQTSSKQIQFHHKRLSISNLIRSSNFCILFRLTLQRGRMKQSNRCSFWFVRGSNCLVFQILNNNRYICFLFWSTGEWMFNKFIILR